MIIEMVLQTKIQRINNPILFGYKIPILLEIIILQKKFIIFDLYSLLNI